MKDDAGSLRLYLTGRLAVEQGRSIFGERRFPSRQARLLFAHLVLEHGRSSSHEELAELLWGEQAPAAWDTALKALVSKLRRAFEPFDALSIESHFGCYELTLPGSVWIDWEAARRALDDAEGAMRSRNPRAAWGPVNVAVAIARRGFLAGEDGSWVESQRSELHDILIRGLECYAEVGLASGQSELAAQAARDVVHREPFRESGYQRLMKALAALGNRAEALRVYHECRKLLDEELGVKPSPETERVFLELLKS